MAGTGKSTIARTVARIYHEQGSLGGNFFFSRGVGELDHATRFVSTVALQLADVSPPLRRHVCEAIDKHPGIGL